MRRIVGPGSRRAIVKNVVVLLGVLLFVTFLVKSNKGYRHVYDKIVQFPATQAKYDTLSYDQRLAVKLGSTAKYLALLKEKTQADAVILMPPDGIFLTRDSAMEFASWINNRGWASYFVYPRKLVYSDEHDSAFVYPRPTHIAIVNYWGYDRLSYPVAEKTRYTVMPL